MLSVWRIIAVLAFAASTATGCKDPVVDAPTRDVDTTGTGDGSTFSNPVFARDFPDPTVIAAPDGMYYAYATETMINAVRTNIQVARSEDLVSWEWLGDALPNGLPWAQQVRHYWAPHVQYAPEMDRYFMYFSAHHDARNGKCMAVAVSDAPAGPFEAVEEPMICGDGFINIDPMAFDDPVSGRKLLYWGSGFEPIKVRELEDDRIRFKADAPTRQLVAPGRDAEYGNLVEGAWVIYRDSTYFMFYSGDSCCGDAAHYAVMVARASDPMGPFQTLGEAEGTNRSAILKANAIWNAPGHNSIIRDAAGNDWIFYHAINRAQPRRETGVPGVLWDRRIMLMDRIVYLSGWPRVLRDEPSQGPQPAPVVDADP